jgi:hypothetical protein
MEKADPRAVLDTAAKRFREAGHEVADNLERQDAAFFLFQAAKDWKAAGHEIDPELGALLVSAIQDACEFDVLFLYDDIANRVTAMIAKCEGVEPTELIIRAIQGTLAKDGLEADKHMIDEFNKTINFLVEFIKRHIGDEKSRKDLIDGWLDSMSEELDDIEDHLTMARALTSKGGGGEVGL